MHELSVDKAQRFHARLAGFLFLFVMAIFIFGEVVVSTIGGTGDLAEVAGRVVASEWLYRVGLLSLAIGALAVMVLSHALYVVLEPVDKRLAQLALYARLGEAFIIGAVLVFRYATLRLYTSAQATAPFETEQADALLSVARSAYGSGVQIWLLFFSLGSTLFFYLFYRSRYIPRPLAAFGVFASIVVGLVSVGSLLLPEHAATIQYGWATSFIAEVTTGFWLLIAGIRSVGDGEGDVSRDRRQIEEPT